MEESECTICFCEFEQNDNKFSCANPDCVKKVCQECLEGLIKYSHEKKLLPKCPSNKCNGTFILSSIKKINKEFIKLYEESCLEYFINDNSDIIKKRIEEDVMLNKLRDERLKFLEQEFPKGISFVASIAFKDKLKIMDKKKKQLINMKLESAKRVCINNICNGYLDENYKCMTCDTPFCKKCEKKIIDNHECKQEDLDSVNLVNNMIKCPKCNLPVFKNVGCDHITCSNCQTNFLYSTGKQGGHGSNNDKINLKTDKKLLSIEYGSILPQNQLDLILKIESKKPTEKNKNMLLIPIQALAKKKISKQNCSCDLAKRVNSYTKYKYKLLKYNKYLVEIEEMITKKDTHILDKLITILNSL